MDGWRNEYTCFAWAGGTFFSFVQFRVKSDTWYKSYHINLYVKPFHYSICIRSIQMKTNTEISFSFWLTLFYSILLALSHRWNHRQRLKYTCFAWVGGTFFPVVLLSQFLVLAGNRFWFYILLMYLGYRTIQLWCCASFFCSGGK